MTAADEPNSGVSETALLEEEALTDESSYDKLMSRGNLTAIPAAAVVAHRTDWEGLTPDEEAARKHKEQEEREEYERVMEEVRTRSDQLMRRLDEQESEVHKKTAEADSRAIVLRDGRRVLVGRNGEYIDEASGQKLEGDDKEEAAGKRKTNSETEDEHNALRSQLVHIQEAREHARTAADLTGQNGANLSPAEKQQRQQQASQELATADALSHEADIRGKHLESSPEAASDLASTDTLGALGIGDAPTRTTSFAASLGAKDSLAATIRPEFTARSNPPAPPMTAVSPVADASAVAAKNRAIQPV